jgi:two-component system LytT family response regulator
MRVLIVDDEPLARSALVEVVKARRDVSSCDVADDGVSALEKLEASTYDAVLLDINMPEMSGLELLERLKERARAPMPAIVFVTAHDRYAMEAFDKHAVDYVLKPFCRDRVDEALDIAFHRTVTERAAKSGELLAKLHGLRGGLSPRIAVKNKGRIVFIEPNAVMAVHAEGNYTLLERESGSYLLRESISALEEKLKDFGFVRIHRSILINRSFVEGIEPRLGGEYELRLKNGREYTVTRTYKKNLRSLAQLWIGTDGLGGD